MQSQPFSHRPGHSIAWGTVPHPFDPHGPSNPAAVYRYEKELPKPCVHPVTTPTGRVLTGFEPSDHSWHRGLWFTIKFVNEENFWEESAPFGTQENVVEPSVEQIDEQGCVVRHRLAWVRPNAETVLREERTLRMEHRGDAIAFDWSTSLTPQRDVVLDRTPYTTWGGYGGLTFRITREMHDVRCLTPEGHTREPPKGQNHPWLGIDGRLDGGPRVYAGVAMFDHPHNPRWPSPFYAKMQSGVTYMNASLLFHEPMTLDQAQTLALRYRVLVKDGQWRGEELATESQQFTQTKAEASASTHAAATT